MQDREMKIGDEAENAASADHVWGFQASFPRGFFRRPRAGRIEIDFLDTLEKLIDQLRVEDIRAATI